jgi:hypothetical protein
MKKLISRFRFEPTEYFIDLADQNGRIGVDPLSGSIFLDEGHGPDRFHGALIRASEFRELTLRAEAGRKMTHVILGFGETQLHDLGSTDDVETAARWTAAVTAALLPWAKSERLATATK